MWVLTIVIFFLLVAPAAALLALFPGELGAWGFAFAFIFAWALKAALLEPLAIAALMQVFFETIEGQAPEPGMGSQTGPRPPTSSAIWARRRSTGRRARPGAGPPAPGHTGPAT